MRKVEFANGERYHIYNRGTDKRPIFSDQFDLQRFLLAIEHFNTLEPIGSIFENQFIQNSKTSKEKQKTKSLVKIISFCLNPNHYHLILEQVRDNGVPKFMQKLGIGYTNYFNIKQRRNGVLFQGKFKAAHIRNNEDLLRLSVYVNLNYRIHQLGNPIPKLALTKSSWEDYIGLKRVRVKKTKPKSLCQPKLILEQFKNQTEYQQFALDLLPILIDKKVAERELETELTLEEI